MSFVARSRAVTRRLWIPDICLASVLGIILGTTDRLSLAPVAAGTRLIGGYDELPLSFEPADTRTTDGSSFTPGTRAWMRRAAPT